MRRCAEVISLGQSRHHLGSDSTIPDVHSAEAETGSPNP